MSMAVFTPKQIAQALGVSESSVKRWVDSGRLPAAKTAGGHRKVPLPSIADFIRETGHHLAEPAVLGMVATSRGATLESSIDELFESLIHGNEPACREIVLSYYQRGETIAAIGDRLIAPAFRRVGDGWALGEIAVHQERRSCEVMMATLHELRRWLPAPADDAPLALVATPSMDFAETSPRLVELTLLAEGWRVVMVGCGLPLSEIGDIVSQRCPRLVCLSVTHLEADAVEFAAELNSIIDAAPSAHDERCQYAVGGTAISASLREQLRCGLVASSLHELVDYQQSLRAN
jgi:excisionase family DNA binding protein